MFRFHSRRPTPDLAARRRAAVRRLHASLTSERLVELFHAIGVLAITNPEAIRTLEVAVARIARRRPLAARRRDASLQESAG